MWPLPLMHLLSLGNDADNFKRLDESLSRVGMAGDMPEYLDYNLASPKLADPEEVQEIVLEIVDKTVGALPTHLIQYIVCKLHHVFSISSVSPCNEIVMSRKARITKTIT